MPVMILSHGANEQRVCYREFPVSCNRKIEKHGKNAGERQQIQGRTAVYMLLSHRNAMLFLLHIRNE